MKETGFAHVFRLNVMIKWLLILTRILTSIQQQANWTVPKLTLSLSASGLASLSCISIISLPRHSNDPALKPLPGCEELPTPPCLCPKYAMSRVVRLNRDHRGQDEQAAQCTLPLLERSNYQCQCQSSTINSAKTAQYNLSMLGWIPFKVRNTERESMKLKTCHQDPLLVTEATQRVDSRQCKFFSKSSLLLPTGIRISSSTETKKKKNPWRRT